MKRKWVSGAGALFYDARGCNVVVHVRDVIRFEGTGIWYGIILPNDHVVHGGIESSIKMGWSLRKAKRKALKHLFKLKF